MFKNVIDVLFLILITLSILGVCATCDADEIIICNEPNDTVQINNSYMNLQDQDAKSTIIGKTKDRVYESYPTITMVGKPSCSRCAGNHIPYKWFTRTYVNYCPNCHYYNCLGNKHKYGSRYEQEITCFRCDSDYCVYDGHEKYSWSSVFLRRA